MGQIENRTNRLRQLPKAQHYRSVTTAATAVCILSLCTLVACAEGDSSDQSSAERALQELASQNNVQYPAFFETDIPWDAIDKLSEERLLYAFAQYELEVRSIRKLGLEYWNSNPDSSKRFEWLLLTTLANPVYVLEPDKWRWNPAWKTALPAAVDTVESGRWREAFPRMREEYLASPAVGEETKYLFRFVELWAGFNSRHAMYGDSAVSDPLLFSKLVEFGRIYQTPLHQDDRRWAAYMQTLVAEIASSIAFENNVFGITEAELKRFLEFCNGVYRPGHPFQRICVELGNHGLDLQPHDVDSLPIYRPSQGYSGLLRLPGMSWPFPSFSGSDHPVPTLEAFTRARLDLQYIQAAEAGITTFRDNPEVTFELAKWTNVVRSNMPYIGSRRFYRGSPLDGPRFDGAEVAALSSELRVIETSIASSDILDATSITSYEFGAARALRNLAIQQYNSTGSHRIGIEYLNRMEELYRKYGRRLGSAASIEDIIFSTDIMDFYYNAGVPEAVANDFLQRFRYDKDPEIRNWSYSIENLNSKRSTPWEFKTTTIHDTTFSLSELRGKIVFIDVWSSTCSSCIYKMPDKHELYQELRDRGVEVVSFMTDLKDRRELANRLIRRHGLEWTTVDGGAEWRRMQDTYGLLGMPKYFVVDRNGLMIGSPSELKSSLVRVREVIDAELSAGG